MLDVGTFYRRAAFGNPCAPRLLASGRPAHRNDAIHARSRDDGLAVRVEEGAHPVASRKAEPKASLHPAVMAPQGSKGIIDSGKGARWREGAAMGFPGRFLSSYGESLATAWSLACLAFCLFKREMPYDLI